MAGIDPEGRDDIQLGSYSVDFGREAGFELAKRPNLPDAVVCANDLIAVGVIRGLLRSGIRVPDDVAITGFDDIALCRYVEPAITTVRQPIENMGAEAANLLLARIDGERGRGTQRAVHAGAGNPPVELPSRGGVGARSRPLMS